MEVFDGFKSGRVGRISGLFVTGSWWVGLGRLGLIRRLV